mgnify:CR=1 FL=1
MGVAADSTRQAIIDTMADLEKQIEVATSAKINRLLNDYYALQAALRHIKDKKDCKCPEEKHSPLQKA